MRIHRALGRGILVLAVAVSSLGAAALAWPPHDSAPRVAVSARQRAGAPAARGGVAALSSGRAAAKPWMY